MYWDALLVGMGIVTLVMHASSFRVTIPMPIIKVLSIKEKDVLEIWLNNSQMRARIEKIKVEKP